MSEQCYVGIDILIGFEPPPDFFHEEVIPVDIARSRFTIAFWTNGFSFGRDLFPGVPALITLLPSVYLERESFSIILDFDLLPCHAHLVSTCILIPIGDSETRLYTSRLHDHLQALLIGQTVPLDRSNEAGSPVIPRQLRQLREIRHQMRHREH